MVSLLSTVMGILIKYIYPNPLQLEHKMGKCAIIFLDLDRTVQHSVSCMKYVRCKTLIRNRVNQFYDIEYERGPTNNL